VDNLIGVDKKGGSTNSANFACAVSKQQVAGEEPSFQQKVSARTKGNGRTTYKKPPQAEHGSDL